MTTMELSNRVINGNTTSAKENLEKELETINKSLAVFSLNTDSTSRDHKPETEIQLQEKKSICLLKLRKYTQTVEDGYRTIGKKGPSVVIFKCIISALCRLRKYDEVHEVLDQWKRLSPKDVHMIETKQKLERILSAVRSGIKPEEVFQNLEQSLGLNSEWIYRKTIAANENLKFQFRVPPSFSQNLSLCSRGQHCIFGDKCTGAHSQEELLEWKLRLEARNKNWEMTRATLIRPNTSLQYLIDITKRINETTNIRKLLTDDVPGVKFKCATDLKRTCYERGKDVTWQMLIVTRSPLRTVSLLHEVHRSNFWISAASFYSVASKESLDLFDLHVVNKGPDLQVCNTFVPASIFQEVSFNATMFGSYRQTLMFDMKFDPKLVKHLSVELEARRNAFVDEELIIDQELKIIKNPQKVNMENYEIVDSDDGVQVNSVFKTSSFIPHSPNNTRIVMSNELTNEFGMHHENVKQQQFGLPMKEAYGYNPLATGNDGLGLANYHDLSSQPSSIVTSQGPLLFGNPIRPQLISPIPRGITPESSSSPQKEDFFGQINSTLDQAKFKSTFEDGGPNLTLDEIQAKDFVDKLLFPNVASIWSNSNNNNNSIIGSGSYDKNTVLSYNDSIWAPPCNFQSPQDSSFFFPSSKLPETTASSHRRILLPQSTQYSSTNSFSTEYLDDIVTSTPWNSSDKLVAHFDSTSLPLHELNVNSQSNFQKDLFNRYTVQSSPIHSKQQLPLPSSSSSNSINFNNNIFSHNNISRSIATNNFEHQEEVPNASTPLGTFKQVSLAKNDIQMKNLTSQNNNNNNNNNDAGRQGQSQQSESLILNQLLSSYQQPSKQPTQQKQNKKTAQYQHQPLFQQEGGFNDSIDYPKMGSSNPIRLSPETSISSPEILDYISPKDFPSLQEVIKGKPDKNQTKKQLQQQSSSQKTNSNISSSSSNCSSSVGNNDWVQVKKKKNKVKDPTPLYLTSGEEKIETLVNMGFDKKIAIKALQHSQRNLDLAIEWLLSKSGNHNGEN